MKEPWGWSATPRKPRPQINGLEVAVGCGLLTRAELLRATFLLTTGFPEGLELAAFWSSPKPNWVKLLVESDGCRMEHTFKGPRHELHVFYDSFMLPLRHAHNGRGSEMIKNALLLYDRLGVKLVRTKTTMDGNTAWAGLRAFPEMPWLERIRLLQHIRECQQDKSVSEDNAYALGRLIRQTAVMNPNDLIFDVMRYRDGDDQVGIQVLQDFSWGAIWRLEDSIQRSLIKDALRGSTRQS